MAIKRDTSWLKTLNNASSFAPTVTMIYATVYATLVLFLISLVLKFTKTDEEENEKGGTKKRLPGPTALPIIGHLHLIGSKSLHVILEELSKVYGGVYSLKLGSWKTLVLCDKQSVNEAFVKKAKVFSGRPNLPTFEYTRHGATGISLCNYSPEFVANRKRAVRAMHEFLSDEETVNTIFSAEASKMMNLFDEIVEQQKELYPLNEFEKIIPSLFLSVMYGVHVPYKDEKLTQIVQSYRAWFDAAEADNPADFFPLLSKIPNPRLSIVKKCGEEFESFGLKMLQKYGEENNNDSAQASNTILKNLLRDDVTECLDEEASKELAKVVSDLIGGGFDTSASTLSWAMLYMANHADVMRKCRDELRSATGNDVVSLDLKDQCPYFSATVYEVLRLSTIAPTGLVHTTIEDTTIRGFYVPKGTLVIPNLRQINHDPLNWEHPETMYPEHFLTPDKKRINDFAVSELATFSSGIRRCPGDKLSYGMIFVLLGTFVKRYDIDLVQPPEDMQPLRGVTSKPKPHLMTLSRASTMEA